MGGSPGRGPEAWLKAVAKNTTDSLRPKYGQYYGFEDAMPRNAEMVAMAMFSYR
jgi:hypothetical protein